MAFLSEAEVEMLVIGQLHSLGYATAFDAQIGPDGHAPEREAYSDVLLLKRLTAAIERLNPNIPAEARGDALRKVLATEMPSLSLECPDPPPPALSMRLPVPACGEYFRGLSSE